MNESVSSIRDSFSSIPLATIYIHFTLSLSLHEQHTRSASPNGVPRMPFQVFDQPLYQVSISGITRAHTRLVHTTSLLDRLGESSPLFLRKSMFINMHHSRVDPDEKLLDAFATSRIDCNRTTTTSGSSTTTTTTTAAATTGHHSHHRP